jgi:hypothetical protein
VAEGVAEGVTEGDAAGNAAGNAAGGAAGDAAADGRGGVRSPTTPALVTQMRTYGAFSTTVSKFCAESITTPSGAEDADVRSVLALAGRPPLAG